MTDNGGPVFPIQQFTPQPNGDVLVREPSDGMIWLDHAAIEFLANSDLSSHDTKNKEDMCAWAYDWAEAMLAEKRRREGDDD